MNQYHYELKRSNEAKVINSEKLSKLECFICGNKVSMINNETNYQEFKCTNEKCNYSKGGLILSGDWMI